MTRHLFFVAWVGKVSFEILEAILNDCRACDEIFLFSLEVFTMAGFCMRVLFSLAHPSKIHLIRCRKFVY